MDEFLKMDVFFVIASIATVVVAALIAWALVRVVRILGKVEDITDSAAAEAELLRDDIATLRTNVKSEGLKFKHLSRFARASMERWMGGKKSR